MEQDRLQLWLARQQRQRGRPPISALWFSCHFLSRSVKASGTQLRVRQQIVLFAPQNKQINQNREKTTVMLGKYRHGPLEMRRGWRLEGDRHNSTHKLAESRDIKPNVHHHSSAYEALVLCTTEVTLFACLKVGHQSCVMVKVGHLFCHGQKVRPKIQFL